MIKHEEPDIHPKRGQSHATFPTKAPRPSTRTRNHDAILNPFAIPTQSANVTAGEYRTRTDRRAVSFTDYAAIKDRTKICNSGQKQGQRSRHCWPITEPDPVPPILDPQSQSDSRQHQKPAIERGQFTCDFTIISHARTCTQSYQSSRNPQSIRNSRHNP